MCDNILLYSNPFKDFFIKRHKSNLHLINRNDFFSLIYKLRIMFISIHCEISDNSYIEGEIASMKNVECHLQINRYPTIDQTRSYSFSLQILRIFIRKKIILQIWTSSLFLCRARASCPHVLFVIWEIFATGRSLLSFVYNINFLHKVVWQSLRLYF